MCICKLCIFYIFSLKYSEHLSKPQLTFLYIKTCLILSRTITNENITQQNILRNGKPDLISKSEICTFEKTNI